MITILFSKEENKRRAIKRLNKNKTFDEQICSRKEKMQNVFVVDDSIDHYLIAAVVECIKPET